MFFKKENRNAWLKLAVVLLCAGLVMSPLGLGTMIALGGMSFGAGVSIIGMVAIDREP